MSTIAKDYEALSISILWGLAVRQGFLRGHNCSKEISWFGTKRRDVSNSDFVG